MVICVRAPGGMSARGSVGALEVWSGAKHRNTGHGVWAELQPSMHFFIVSMQNLINLKQ